MPDTTPNRPPLWQVMRDALWVIGIPPERHAAELRAIRDWLVPVTPEPALGATGTRDELQDWVDWNARTNIWWELTEEADRAEGFPLDSPEVFLPGNPMGPEAGQ